MSYTEKELEATADSIINWAFSDSHVRIDKPVLMEQLRCDWELAGRLPTEKECELLITGDDDGGVPEELQDEFPQTNEFIKSYWE